MSGTTINNHYAARPLDDEEVWLRIFEVMISGRRDGLGTTDEASYAAHCDRGLEEFRKRFPRKIEAKNAESV